MRTGKGIFAVSRKIFVPNKQHNPYAGDAIIQSILCSLISWANWKSSKGTFGEKAIDIPRGTVLTSYAELCAVAGCTVSQARTRLARLRDSHVVDMLNNRGGLLVTLLNYERYQDFGKEDRRADLQDLSSRSILDPFLIDSRSQHDKTTKQQNKKTAKQEYINTAQVSQEQPTSLRSGVTSLNDPSQNQVNLNADKPNAPYVDIDMIAGEDASELRFDVPDYMVQKTVGTTVVAQEIDIDVPASSPVQSLVTQDKKPKKVKPSKAEPEDRSLAMKWADYTSANWPHIEVNVAKWSESIAKVRSRKGLNHKEMEGIFDFARKDDFWNDKIQSPCSLLRVGKNDLSKVDNILSAIKRKHFKYEPALEHMRAIDRGEVKLNTNWFLEG